MGETKRRGPAPVPYIVHESELVRMERALYTPSDAAAGNKKREPVGHKGPAPRNQSYGLPQFSDIIIAVFPAIVKIAQEKRPSSGSGQVRQTAASVTGKQKPPAYSIHLSYNCSV